MKIKDAVRIYKQHMESFYGHAGRPGMRGGSAPGKETQFSMGLLDRIDHDGGFTVSRSGKSPHSGYALSISPENERIVNMKDLTTKKVKSIIHEYDAILKKEPHSHIGGWRDPESGKIFFDVSVVTNNKSEAIKLAKKYNQLAIYDLKRGKTIQSGVKRKLSDQAEPRKVKGGRKLVRFDFARNASAEDIVAALKKDAEND